MDASALERALQERLLREIRGEHASFQNAPQINIHNALPRSVSEALSAGGSNSPGNAVKAAEKGLTPEELEYLVDISKRDVREKVGIDPETGEEIFKTIGWDKKVHRYTMLGEHRENPARSNIADWHGDNSGDKGPFAAMGESGLPEGPLKKKKKRQESKGLDSLF